ncbi:hypothetical protein WL27_26395 [Burkholderia multivorans]|nr:hypothetical protein WL27_26395 [Burkholderia multivorans]
MANSPTALSGKQDAHVDTRLAAQRRAVEIEEPSQQMRGQILLLAEHDSFRQSVEEKLRHAHEALEHFQSASRA